MVDVVDQYYSVIHHNPHQDKDADEGHQIEIGSGDEEEPEDSHYTKKDTGDHTGWIQQRFKKRGHNQVDQKEGDANIEEHYIHRFNIISKAAAITPGITRWIDNLVHHFRDFRPGFFGGDVIQVYTNTEGGFTILAKYPTCTGALIKIGEGGKFNGLIASYIYGQIPEIVQGLPVYILEGKYYINFTFRSTNSLYGLSSHRAGNHIGYGAGCQAKITRPIVIHCQSNLVTSGFRFRTYISKPFYLAQSPLYLFGEFFQHIHRFPLNKHANLLGAVTADVFKCRLPYRNFREIFFDLLFNLSN